ncbi:FAD/NAD(P)-binding protein [Metabacillus sp. 84]|uniref:FAD/NAD(P)-binding protein n=1 Tax=unclassified Metabacillus TaxID=2675274 RepID=UPI003CF3DDF0
MLEWTIIGGGIQGIAAASFLIESRKASVEDIRIIDPNSEPLAHWKKCTSLISMPFLRSPSVHHLECDPFGLLKYAKEKESSGLFYGRYKRPALNLFNEHSDQLIESAGLQSSWIQDRAKSIVRDGQKWRITVESGQFYDSKNVILAIGIGEQPALPKWAEDYACSCTEQVYHIFNDHLPPLHQLKGPITVIGGGITAAHLLIKLAGLYPGNIHQIIRHKHRIMDFDSDPAWIGEKNQAPFRKIRCYSERRRKIKEARHKGSMSRELSLKLRRLEAEKKLSVAYGNPSSIDKVNSHLYRISFFDQEPSVQAGTILFATGFENKIPGADLLAPLIKNENLPCAECGFPIVTEKLEWAPSLYVMGALAELEIGPISRNIAGARQAAERIISSN